MAYKDGLPVASNLFEAAAWHKAIKITCRCGQSVTFDPHGLWWLFERKGWDIGLREASSRFACQACRTAGRGTVQPIRIETISGPAQVKLPMPPEGE